MSSTIPVHDDICNDYASPSFFFFFLISGFKTEFAVPWNLITSTLYPALTNFSFYVYCAGYQPVFLITAISKSLYHKCFFRHTMMSAAVLNNLHILSSESNSVSIYMSSIKVHYTVLHLSFIILLHIPCICKFAQIIALAQEVSCLPLTTETWVQSLASPWGICGVQCGTGTSFSLSASVFPCQHHFTNVSYSFIYHQLYTCIYN